jgi:DNA-binding CsgD family transcriptional regulator
MPQPAASLDAARAAYTRRDWSSAEEQFARQSAAASLDADDLVRWGRTAWWLGRATEAVSRSEAAFGALLADGRVHDAVDTALRVALLRTTVADLTVGPAWMRNAAKLLEDSPDPVLTAHLTYLEAALGLTPDGVAWSVDAVARLRDLAHRTPARAVAALCSTVEGMAELNRGDTTVGFAKLDDAMVGVLTGDLEPEWAGDILCTTIHACHQLADFRRMADWTRAMEDWSKQFDSDAIYAGVCRVHRLELRSVSGDWDAVEDALTVECTALQLSNAWVAGEGWHQLGELRRLRGDSDAAREAYGRARACGVDPVPGEALLVLEEGDPARALTMIRHALAERDPLARVRLLRPGVEISIATGDHAAAVMMCDELRRAATRYSSNGFAAWAQHAEGIVALHGRDHVAAIEKFTDAAEYYRAHDHRCEHAGALAWLAAAHEAAGQSEQAAHVRSLAATLFESLGARHRLQVMSVDAPDVGPLTAREAEVLAEVTSGASNRAVAQRLFISEKTVGRHLANIYLKLGVGSRTAAAAWWHARSGTTDALHAHASDDADR